jgi:hypothetical protein
VRPRNRLRKSAILASVDEAIVTSAAKESDFAMPSSARARASTSSRLLISDRSRSRVASRSCNFAICWAISSALAIV